MKRSVSFNIACWILVIVLAIRLAWNFTGANIGFGMEGLARIGSLGIMAVLLLDHTTRFSFVFKYEKALSLLIVTFLFLMVVQCAYLDNTVFNIQGSIKFFFYFGFILICLYGAIIYSDDAITTLLNICVLFFMSVLIFYPYLIAESGVDPITRLLKSDSRAFLLLQASNEDAHFMTTLMMLVYLRLRKNKVLVIGLASFFYLAMIYNGTRSALMIAILQPIIFYILYKRKFVSSAIVLTVVILLSLPYLTTFIESKFEKDLAVLTEAEDLAKGKEVGGTFSWRIAHLWLPVLDYTFEHSPVIGHGSNGWDIVIPKILNGESNAPHNFFIWSLVNWGLIGLVLIILLFYIPIKYVIRAYLRNEDDDDRFTSVALICAWMEFLVWSFLANSNNSEGWTILCILIVLSISLKYKYFSRDLLQSYESVDRKHA